MANRKNRRHSQNRRESVRLANIQKAAMDAGLHESRLLAAAYCIAIREFHHFGRERLERIIHRSAELIFNASCAQELADRLKDETGIDLEVAFNEEAF